MHVSLDYSTGSRAEALFRKAAARLDQTQAELLQCFLDGARKCEFARRHGLARVRTVREFQDAVPIAGYDAMADDVVRMQGGAQGIRFDDAVETFVQTGGTSGRSKVLPRRRLRNSELAGRLIDHSLQNALLAHDHPEVDGGKALYIVGGAPAGQIPFGSAHTYATIYKSSAASRRLLLIDPAWLRVLLDAPTRFYVTARLALGADVRYVSGLAPALLVLAQTMAGGAETLLRDIRDGTITADLSAEARAVLPAPAPDPELAAELARRAAAAGQLLPRVAWPSLSFTQCMMSSALGNNRPALREAYGAPLRESGYSSTEAPGLAFPLRDEDTNLLLGIHSAFCEFVDDADKIHLAHEISVGCTYRLLLTTAHGLYRYDTQDLLEVTGRELDGAPMLQFVGRARVSNLMGEKLSEVQVSEAISRAVARLPGVELHQFVLIPRAPRAGVVPHYELRTEPRGEAFDPRALAEALEEELVAANVLYEANRFGGALGSARVTVAPSRWFEVLRAHMETLSQSAKVPVFLPEAKLPPDDTLEP